MNDFTAALVRNGQTARGDSKDHDIATLGVTTSTAADLHSHGQVHGDANGPNAEYVKNKVAKEVAPLKSVGSRGSSSVSDAEIARLMIQQAEAMQKGLEQQTQRVRDVKNERGRSGKFVC